MGAGWKAQWASHEVSNAGLGWQRVGDKDVEGVSKLELLVGVVACVSLRDDSLERLLAFTCGRLH
eukprot:5401259-Amphidinium_carterae.1